VSGLFDFQPEFAKLRPTLTEDPHPVLTGSEWIGNGRPDMLLGVGTGSCPDLPTAPVHQLQMVTGLVGQLQKIDV
jgi:hypothetical protein